MNNPVLCDADRVTVNAHAFYDGNQRSSDAGTFIDNIVMPNIRKSCAPYSAVNNIVITESGWPSRGGNNGVAVASLGDEQTALSRLNCAGTVCSGARLKYKVNHVRLMS
jgi:exo-beta-1,3-glucanase (GH17 family)